MNELEPGPSVIAATRIKLNGTSQEIEPACVMRLVTEGEGHAGALATRHSMRVNRVRLELDDEGAPVAILFEELG